MTRVGLARHRATEKERLQVGLLSVQHDSGRRAAEVLRDFTESLNRRCAFSSILLTRAMLEIAAHLAHSERCILDPLQPGVTSAAQLDELRSAIDRSLVGGRFNWSQWFENRSALFAAYSAGDKPTLKPEIEQVNVMTMVAKLDERVARQSPGDAGRICAYYGALSDMCHPAVGGVLLFISPSKNIDPEYITYSGETEPEAFASILTTVLLPTLRLSTAHAANVLMRFNEAVKSISIEPTSPEGAPSA